MEKALPPAMLDCLKARHEMRNSPTYGVSENFAHTGLQLNFANPTAQVIDLSSQLGVAGGGHTDNQDCPASRSVMTCESCLRPEVHPGVFFILELGIYVVLRNSVSIVFSGRRKHGGTAPIVPPAYPLTSWETRLTVISYPNERILDRLGALCLSPMWEEVRGNIPNSVFASPARVDLGGTIPRDVSHARCTMTVEGRQIMSPETYERWMARELYLIQAISKANYQKFWGELPSIDWPLSPYGEDAAKRPSWEDTFIDAAVFESERCPSMYGFQIYRRDPQLAQTRFNALRMCDIDPCHANDTSLLISEQRTSASCLCWSCLILLRIFRRRPTFGRRFRG
jgi:hypothetical protein